MGNKKDGSQVGDEGGPGVVVLVIVLGALAAGVLVTGLVRAGRRESAAERARLAGEAALAARRSMDTVWAMDDRQFEDHVAALCRRDGCSSVQRVGGAGDLGADVTATLPDGRRLVIQCKRYAPHRSVGSRDIQLFNGTARLEHHADVPLFVASCVFTKPARTFAAKHRLTLIDVDLLGFWNNGTPLTSFLDLDIARSGTNRRLGPAG
ncbi:restriction endonuclease [Kitasatospora sp. NBC_01302]|uniref:restriction endonuclease n=1 Tax=Kitasatospora sp. NBC_01302 TaxID=2903575 RepID=UPI002E0F3438|nr:restriction endonuclease [Kitasatospora sp. NBC_01302]